MSKENETGETHHGLSVYIDDKGRRLTDPTSNQSDTDWYPVQTDPKGKGSPLFWFSVTAKVSLANPAHLLDRIWVAGDGKFYSLLDP